MYKKRDKTVKSKKGLRRHLKKCHETMGKPACKSHDNMFNRRTDSRVHAHEHDDDDEEGKNDEAKVKPNSRSIKKGQKEC